jgi:hypothetical protein
MKQAKGTDWFPPGHPLSPLHVPESILLERFPLDFQETFGTWLTQIESLRETHSEQGNLLVFAFLTGIFRVVLGPPFLIESYAKAIYLFELIPFLPTYWGNLECDNDDWMLSLLIRKDVLHARGAWTVSSLSRLEDWNRRLFAKRPTHSNKQEIRQRIREIENILQVFQLFSTKTVLHFSVIHSLLHGLRARFLLDFNQSIVLDFIACRTLYTEVEPHSWILFDRLPPPATSFHPHSVFDKWMTWTEEQQTEVVTAFRTCVEWCCLDRPSTEHTDLRMVLTTLSPHPLVNDCRAMVAGLLTNANLMLHQFPDEPNQWILHRALCWLFSAIGRKQWILTSCMQRKHAARQIMLCKLVSLFQEFYNAESKSIEKENANNRGKRGSTKQVEAHKVASMVWVTMPPETRQRLWFFTTPVYNNGYMPDYYFETRNVILQSIQNVMTIFQKKGLTTVAIVEQPAPTQPRLLDSILHLPCLLTGNPLHTKEVHAIYRKLPTRYQYALWKEFRGSIVLKCSREELVESLTSLEGLLGPVTIIPEKARSKICFKSMVSVEPRTPSGLLNRRHLIEYVYNRLSPELAEKKSLPRYCVAHSKHMLFSEVEQFVASFLTTTIESWNPMEQSIFFDLVEHIEFCGPFPGLPAHYELLELHSIEQCNRIGMGKPISNLVVTTTSDSNPWNYLPWSKLNGSVEKKMIFVQKEETKNWSTFESYLEDHPAFENQMPVDLCSDTTNEARIVSSTLQEQEESEWGKGIEEVRRALFCKL